MGKGCPESSFRSRRSGMRDQVSYFASHLSQVLKPPSIFPSPAPIIFRSGIRCQRLGSWRMPDSVYHVIPELALFARHTGTYSVQVNEKLSTFAHQLHR